MIKTPSFQCWGVGLIPGGRTKIPHVVVGCQLVSNSLETPWSVGCRAPLSMGFSRQEYFSGLPLPSPRDPPKPGIGPVCLELAGRFLTAEPPGKSVRSHALHGQKKKIMCSNPTLQIGSIKKMILQAIVFLSFNVISFNLH